MKNLGKKIKKWKHYLPLINLALFISAISFTIVCVMFVYYPSENTIESEKNREEIPVKNKPLPSLTMTSKTIDHYDLILSNNPFSPNRTAWTPPEAKTGQKHADSAKHEEEAAAAAAASVENQQKPRGTPKKITLRGVLILGETKKALIENPDKTQNQKAFIFIEEGEEIAEYKVKNIESDQIKLDWYGEEQVVVMRSNIRK
jgi:hypothetical protein